MQTLLKERGDLDPETVGGLVASAGGKALGVAGAQPIDIINVAKRIQPRTAGQARYVDSTGTNRPQRFYRVVDSSGA